MLLLSHPAPSLDTGNDAKLSPEFLEVDSSRDPGAVPPGGAHSDAEVRKGAAPPERLVLSILCLLSFLWGLYELVVFVHPVCVVY